MSHKTIAAVTVCVLIAIYRMTTDPHPSCEDAKADAARITAQMLTDARMCESPGKCDVTTSWFGFDTVLVNVPDVPPELRKGIVQRLNDKLHVAYFRVSFPKTPGATDAVVLTDRFDSMASICRTVTNR